jgi:hypothetical protein
VDRFPPEINQPDVFYHDRVRAANNWLLRHNIQVTNDRIRQFGISAKRVNEIYWML